MLNSNGLTQPTLIDGAPVLPRRNAPIMALNKNDTDCLRGIMILHNDGRPFDLDPAYNVGGMWKGLPPPLLKYDINPQRSDVECHDVRELPLHDGVIRSIAFDPPFLIRTGQGSAIKNQYSSFESYADLLETYRRALEEFSRVLVNGGIVAFKCQAMVNSGKQHWSPQHTFDMAGKVGFYVLDQFFRLGNPIIQTRKTQRHARKNVCVWWVFRK